MDDMRLALLLLLAAFFAPVSAADAPAPSFVVERFVVSGDNPLDVAATDAALAPFLGEHVGIDGLNAARDALVAADHIVFVFPLWLGTMPALVKAFLEQVMRPGVAFEYQENGLPKKLLEGRSARLVVTMGMPVAAYRWFFFEHGLKGLERNVLHFVGIKPIRESLFGMVASATESRRRGWLRRMKEMGRKAA